MNFKEMLDGDLDLFFDLTEVGENITFKGKEMIAVKSSESFRTKYKGKAEDMGIYTGGISISIKKTDLPLNLAPNDRVTIDGESYEILDIEDLGNTYRVDVVTNYR